MRTIDIGTSLQEFRTLQGGQNTHATKAKARELLDQIQTGLMKPDGTSCKGTLSLKDGVLKSTHWWNRIGKSDMRLQNASELVKELMTVAYGNHEGKLEVFGQRVPQPGQQVQQALTLDIEEIDLRQVMDRYLATNSNEFSTRSFVKLLGAVKNPDLESSSIKGVSGKLSLEPFEQLSGTLSLGRMMPRTSVDSVPPSVREQLDKLNGHLSDQAKEAFANLLQPLQGVQEIGNPPTFVLGDSDGSVARMVLLGIQSGHVELRDDLLEKLGAAMNKEARLIKLENNDIEGFQSDKPLSDDLAEIVQNATYKDSGNSLVFIGDIVHDRFSCNKEAMATLIRQLHDKGAVFILGNHDSTDEAFRLDRTDGQEKPDGRSFGQYAQVQLSKEDSRELEKCFVNSHYVDGKFYSHNGVKPLDDGRFQTAFGVVSASSPSELSKKMNQLTYQKDDEGEVSFTSFRPKDAEMSSDLLGQVGKDGDRYVLFIHGHDDRFQQTGRVLNLNARSGPQGAFDTVSVKI